MAVSTLLESQIRERFDRVQEQIANAARLAGRNENEVRLVVVTKTHPPETIRTAISAGATDLGENYAEEGVEKINALAMMGVDLSPVRFHMIGHVQSRKAALIARHFDLIHSLDSVKLAQRLNRSCEEYGRSLPIFLQLNVSGEESKSGFPAWDERQQNSLANVIAEMLEYTHLSIQGLMTLPPFFDDPEHARPYFRKLRKWRELLAQQFPQASWEQLSMGMSGDFEAAIQEGATLVRIGTAILGTRVSYYR